MKLKVLQGHLKYRGINISLTMPSLTFVVLDFNTSEKTVLWSTNKFTDNSWQCQKHFLISGRESIDGLYTLMQWVEEPSNDLQKMQEARSNALVKQNNSTSYQRVTLCLLHKKCCFVVYHVWKMRQASKCRFTYYKEIMILNWATKKQVFQWSTLQWEHHTPDSM